VECVKTVSELYAPVSGKVVAVNDKLSDAPDNINRAPYEDGWMVSVELSDPVEWDDLWPAERYRETYGNE